MKYADVIKAEPIAVRKREAALMVGGEAVLSKLIDAQLLQPSIASHKLTVFDVADLRAAWTLLKKAQPMTKTPLTVVNQGK